MPLLTNLCVDWFVFRYNEVWGGGGAHTAFVYYIKVAHLLLCILFSELLFCIFENVKVESKSHSRSE